jgi:RNA polymerase sigma-70 factor (ECF subfamily)
LVPVGDDLELVGALRRRDEDAFRRVVVEYHAGLVRTARGYVATQGAAEEVAQDTWLAVIRGIDRFECRSSFKTWLFHIAVNQARTRASREARTLPIGVGEDDDGPSVPANRFLGLDHPRWPRHWCAEPTDWGLLPEQVVDSAATRQLIDATIAAMPLLQRQVVTMRDIEGLTAGEVCDILEISQSNQRVLLHRARSKLRAQLEAHLQGVSTA